MLPNVGVVQQTGKRSEAVLQIPMNLYRVYDRDKVARCLNSQSPKVKWYLILHTLYPSMLLLAYKINAFVYALMRLHVPLLVKRRVYATVPDPSSVCVCVCEEGSATPDYIYT